MSRTVSTEAAGQVIAAEVDAALALAADSRQVVAELAALLRYCQERRCTQLYDSKTVAGTAATMVEHIIHLSTGDASSEEQLTFFQDNIEPMLHPIQSCGASSGHTTRLMLLEAEAEAMIATRGPGYEPVREAHLGLACAEVQGEAMPPLFVRFEVERFDERRQCWVNKHSYVVVSHGGFSGAHDEISVLQAVFGSYSLAESVNEMEMTPRLNRLSLNEYFSKVLQLMQPDRHNITSLLREMHNPRSQEWTQALRVSCRSVPLDPVLAVSNIRELQAYIVSQVEQHLVSAEGEPISFAQAVLDRVAATLTQRHGDGALNDEQYATAVGLVLVAQMQEPPMTPVAPVATL